MDEIGSLRPALIQMLWWKLQKLRLLAIVNGQKYNPDTEYVDLSANIGPIS